jgi:hypothetical protein
MSTIPFTGIGGSAHARASAHRAHTREIVATERLLAEEAESLRRPLLAIHHDAARREDLEDLYAQAVLELLVRIRRDPTLREPAHIANALRLKFKSRIADHQRAVAGRSPIAAALARAAPIDSTGAPGMGRAPDLEEQVLVREAARELLGALAALPAQQRDAVLIAANMRGVLGETERKRSWRARLTLRARLRAAGG